MRRCKGPPYLIVSSIAIQVNVKESHEAECSYRCEVDLSESLSNAGCNIHRRKGLVKEAGAQIEGGTGMISPYEGVPQCTIDVSTTFIPHKVRRRQDLSR